MPTAKLRVDYYLNWPSPLQQELFIKKVNRVHQQITEQSMETVHEFYSEQDMIDNGWKEWLGQLNSKCKCCNDDMCSFFVIVCLYVLAILIIVNDGQWASSFHPNMPKDQDCRCESVLLQSQRVHDDLASGFGWMGLFLFLNSPNLKKQQMAQDVQVRWGHALLGGDQREGETQDTRIIVPVHQKPIHLYWNKEDNQGHAGGDVGRGSGDWWASPWHAWLGLCSRMPWLPWRLWFSKFNKDLPAVVSTRLYSYHVLRITST